MALRRWTNGLANRLYSFLQWIEGDPPEIKDPRKAFQTAFSDIFPIYLLSYAVLIVLLFVNLGDWLAMNPQALGLAFDVAGAAILAKGLLQSPVGIIIDSSTYPLGTGAPRAGYVPASKKAIDAFFGIGFLLTGFFVQGLAVMGII